MSLWTHHDLHCIYCLRRESFVEDQGSLQDVSFDLLLDLPSVSLEVFRGKGRGSVEEFEHQDAQPPDIDAFVVATAEDHFGRQIIGSAAKSVPDFIVEIRPAEVCDFEGVSTKQDVFGLQVPVDDRRGFVVEVGNCGYNIDHE